MSKYVNESGEPIIDTALTTMVDMYKFVGDSIRRKSIDTGFGIGVYICSFEISYNNIEWSTIVVSAELDVDENVWFDTDFWEGEQYIRNLKICPIDLVIFPDEV